MIMSLPAPEEPPMIETTRLGAMATILVTKFLIHFFIFKSKKPYQQQPNKNPSLVTPYTKTF